MNSMDLEFTEKKKIFSSNNLEATFIDLGRNQTVVSFDYWKPHKKDFGSGRNGVPKNAPYNLMEIRTSRNDWYHSPDYADFLKSLHEWRSKDNRNLMMYGMSMGGYGALLLTAELSAEKVIVLAPQFSANPEIVRFEHRWRDERRKVEHFIHELRKSEADGVLIYDPCLGQTLCMQN